MIVSDQNTIMDLKGVLGARAEADFYRSVLPVPVEGRLRIAAASAGVSLNTLFCAALVRAIRHDPSFVGRRIDRRDG